MWRISSQESSNLKSQEKSGAVLSLEPALALTMPRFEFATLWRFEAPLDAVWDAVYHSENWPQWWRGLTSVVRLSPEGSDVVGSVQRFTWKGALPYRLTFDILTTRVEHQSLIEGVASGDLAGVGTWRLSWEEGVTVVRYDWKVSMARSWLKALAFAARPLVSWNHDKIMQWGERGLSERLKSGIRGTRV